MSNAITNPKQRVPIRERKSNRENLMDELRIYLPVLVGVLAFALLIFSSVSHGNLFLSDLLTVGFIALFALVIRTTQSENVAHKIRRNRKNTSK